MPNELQLLTKEQERELYRDWPFPLADFGYHAHDENEDGTPSNPRETHETTSAQQQSGDTVDVDSDFEENCDTDAESMYDAGDYTSIFSYAEPMPDVDDKELSENDVMGNEDNENAMDEDEGVETEMEEDEEDNEMDEDEEEENVMDEDEDESESVDFKYFDVGPTPPSPTSEEKENIQEPEVMPEPANSLRRSTRSRKPTQKAAASHTPLKTATSGNILSQIRNMKEYDKDREVFVCLGQGGCERLFARADGCKRHLKMKGCHGKCVGMSWDKYLGMFPGSEEKLKSHFERRNKVKV